MQHRSKAKGVCSLVCRSGFSVGYGVHRAIGGAAGHACSRREAAAAAAADRGRCVGAAAQGRHAPAGRPAATAGRRPAVIPCHILLARPQRGAPVTRCVKLMFDVM